MSYGHNAQRIVVDLVDYQEAGVSDRDTAGILACRYRSRQRKLRQPIYRIHNTFGDIERRLGTVTRDVVALTFQVPGRARRPYHSHLMTPVFTPSVKPGDDLFMGNAKTSIQFGQTLVYGSEQGLLITDISLDGLGKHIVDGQTPV